MARIFRVPPPVPKSRVPPRRRHVVGEMAASHARRFFPSARGRRRRQLPTTTTPSRGAPGHASTPRRHIRRRRLAVATRGPSSTASEHLLTESRRVARALLREMDALPRPTSRRADSDLFVCATSHLPSQRVHRTSSLHPRREVTLERRQAPEKRTSARSSETVPRANKPR